MENEKNRKPETITLTPKEGARVIFGFCYHKVKTQDHRLKHKLTKELAQYIQLSKIEVLRSYGIRSDYEQQTLKEINKL